MPVLSVASFFNVDNHDIITVRAYDIDEEETDDQEAAKVATLFAASLYVCVSI